MPKSSIIKTGCKLGSNCLIITESTAFLVLAVLVPVLFRLSEEPEDPAESSIPDAVALLLLWHCSFALNLSVFKRMGIRVNDLFGWKTSNSSQVIAVVLRQTMILFAAWVLAIVAWHLCQVFDHELDVMFPSIEADHVVMTALFFSVALFGCAVWTPHARTRFRVMRMLMMTCLTPFVATTYERSYAGNVLSSMTKFFTAAEISVCFILVGGESPFLLDADRFPLNITNGTNIMAGIYQHQSDLCMSQLKYAWAVMAIFPNWIKMMQGLRRGVDAARAEESDCARHFLNALKYGITISVSVVATVMSTQGLSPLMVFQLHAGSHPLVILWLVLSIITCIYKYLWDVLVDWQIGRRDAYMYHRGIYVMAMVMNGVLRVAWVFTISPGHEALMESNALSHKSFVLVCAILEICRRCIWTFIKVEKDHVRKFGSGNTSDDDEEEGQMLQNLLNI